MEQMQDVSSSALDALRAASSTGHPSAMRHISPDAVVQNEETVLPELLRLCAADGAPLALLNASWKLLLATTTFSATGATLHATLLCFMLTQLRHHIFSHDWTDARRTRFAAFVASHLVSAVRAHPARAAAAHDVVDALVELYAAVCVAVAGWADRDAAQQLHDGVAVRLLAVLEALSAGAGGGLGRLLAQCTAIAPPGGISAQRTAPTAAALSLSALTAFLTVLRAALAAGGPMADGETLLTATLLWLPGMAETIPPDAACALPCHVARHAGALPPGVFFADDAAGRGWDGQLLRLLRSLSAAVGGAVSAADGPLLRRRPLALLLAALLVPGAASAARVLLAWEAVLGRLGGDDLAALAAELIGLGEAQLRARGSAPAGRLRRLVRMAAALLAAVCRRLRLRPALLPGGDGRFGRLAQHVLSVGEDGRSGETDAAMAPPESQAEEGAPLEALEGPLMELPARVAACRDRRLALCGAARVLETAAASSGVAGGVIPFVAAELLARAAFVPSAEEDFIASVRRLVSLSFDGAEGFARCHAALCLRVFAEHHAGVPVAALRLDDGAAAALVALLRGPTPAEADHVALCHCQGRNGGRQAATGRFVGRLQKCEEALRAVALWRAEGNALDPTETAALERIEGLMGAMREEGGQSPEVIQVD